ncbi:hypothetical protein ACK1FX_004505 [Salmonella enterica]|nr:hypothetical protein [Salmonella enterica subsp. enterica serovar Newport]EEH3937883.1 hypothetical protein [Salmonella enterica subsp. enterica serovar Newport]
MKRVNISLKKRGILFSLVLLSPEIMAAETLNFNYTRADVLSLEPRLGLQAKACHSKADPMDIHVMFSQWMDIKKPYKITLEINGSAYAKSYAAFSPSLIRIADVVNNTDFMVPWSVSAKGKVKVSETSLIEHPFEPAHNENPFCFSNAGPRYYSVIYGMNEVPFLLLPIFKNPPYYADPLGRLNGGDFYAKCQYWLDKLTTMGKDAKDSIDYYWPYVDRTSERYRRLTPWWNIGARTGSYFIQDSIHDPDSNDAYEFLTVENGHHIFFESRVPAQPARTESLSQAKGYAMNDNCTVSKCSFTIPVGYGEHGNLILEKTDFLFKLNNRNVSSMVLTFIYDKDTYIWKWVRDDSLSINNVLQLTQGGGGNAVLPAESDASDPYNNFYVNGFLSFYRGTLVSENSMKMNDYKNYIENTMPLSLPANQMGDINLVNTDSLMFILGGGSKNNNVPTLEVFGQPLKFAPLTVNGKKVASAMEVRNACY